MLNLNGFQTDEKINTSNVFKPTIDTLMKEEKLYNFYNRILKKLENIKQSRTKYINDLKSHKSLWKNINQRVEKKLEWNAKKKPKSREYYWNKKG